MRGVFWASFLPHQLHWVPSPEAASWPGFTFVVSLASILEAGLEIGSLLRVMGDSDFC